jgi:hypothetical protein
MRASPVTGTSSSRKPSIIASVSVPWAIVVP